MKEIKISYAITVNDEYEEIQKLIKQILEFKEKEDEIVILQDIIDGKGEKLISDIKHKIFRYLTKLEAKNKNFKFITHSLNDDFATHKNFLNKNCTKDYILQLDADELLSDYFLENINQTISQNKIIEVYRIPRINTVEGITSEHIKKWGWRINKKGWINWPDEQKRCFKNDPNIKWEGKVHEHLIGYQYITHFPYEEKWAIKHPKKIKKQEKQNKMYERIIKKEKN